jgi:hypothetical protein
MKINGLHASRLKVEQNNPREIAFAKQWELENSYITENVVGCLGMLLSTESNETSHRRVWLELGEPTKRDEIVAATVVQWLGSNCGMDFLRQSLKRCGYELQGGKPFGKEQR